MFLLFKMLLLYKCFYYFYLNVFNFYLNVQVGASRPCSANFTRSTLCALIACNSWRRARSKNTATSLIATAALRDCSAESSSSLEHKMDCSWPHAPLNKLIFSLFTWIFVFFFWVSEINRKQSATFVLQIYKTRKNSSVTHKKLMTSETTFSSLGSIFSEHFFLLVRMFFFPN